MPRLPLTLAALALPALFALASCTAAEAPTPTAAASPSGGSPSGAATMAVELKSFAFVPKEVRVKAGESVQFRLTATDIDHTFTVPDLDIDWLVKPGTPVTQTHTFTAAGTHRLICAIPGHEGAGMVGSLIVQ